MPVDISDVRSIVEAQDDWRGHHTINLIASENVQSPAVRDIQSSDFMARYAEGHPNRGDEVLRYYQGTKYIDQIETMAREELIALTKTRQADVRPISGNNANTAIAQGCRARDIPILYDAAHVFGLIAGGQFQDPWREGATWVTASTHKTFPGPQRGVIVSDLDEEAEKRYWPSADRGVFPGSSSN